MADFAASFLAQIADSTIKYVGAVIKRQFIYLCCFSSNITGLTTEAEKLDDAIQGLQARVDAATNNVEDIDPKVASWLRGSGKIKEDTDRILNEAQNVESGCLRVTSRFSLSKKAIKTVAAMVLQQREISNFSIISLPPRIAASRTIPLGTSAYEFESRKQIEVDIMTALRGDEKNIIGICGMGGLGKTTLAKRIMNRVLEEHVFDEVVLAVVSQQVDESKIQLEIGGSLGLDLKHEAWQARVQKLHDRLVGKKKILLVLDDVWKSLNLNDLGIPCDDGSKGCTILITSRNSDALSAMDVREVFGMKHLSEEDAWFLFRNKAGTCVDEGKLTSTAQKVARECNGLPIALATVGAALKDEKDVRIWKNALKQLRKPNPNSTPDFIAQVYNPVIISYDNLYSEEVKSLLLLCCLFPEDSKISIHQLTYFCMGLGLFEDIGSLAEARDMTWTSIKNLKDRSLLLDSEEGDYVRMHDVVRDVCVFISKKKGYIGGNDCTWVFSSRERIELSTPNLHLLSLEQVEIDDTFFEGIRELKVLSIQSYSLISLPQTTQLLKNLRTLCLYFCTQMETISIIGDLVNLEILICIKCNLVKELPLGMKRLNRLKLLDLSECSQLQSIGRGIISSLVELEELKMLESFNKWEGDDGERENAGVRELESLTNLRCLEIEIADYVLAAQNMQLSSKLERFKIEIPHHMFNSYKKGCNKNLALHCDVEGIWLGHWIEMQLLRDTESLSLTGDGANKLDFKKMQNIRKLVLGMCESVNNFGFPLIEYLHLFSVDKQEEIWDAPVSLFTNLSSIEIVDCPRLHNLGQLLIGGNDCLPQLENIDIKYCEMMEQVFLCSEQDQHKNISGAPDRHITKLIFPKLKKLDLYLLPNLTTFCQGIEGIEFPLLTEISIRECPRMRSIISTTPLKGNESNHNIWRGANNADVDDHHCSSHLFRQLEKASLSSLKKLKTQRNPLCGHKIYVSEFKGLEYLRITEYRGSKSLFTSSMTENLVNLRELFIGYSDELEQVIKDERQKGASGGVERNRLFPNLEILKLDCLVNLGTFCECECDIELPSLMLVTIENCRNMKLFSLGSLSAPKWQDLKTSLGNCLDVVANVSFGNMKNLELRGIENPLCRYKVNVSLFNGLEQLEICWYRDRMSLFRSSFAGNLFTLKKLKVYNCNEMSKVIEDGEEEEEEDKVGNLPVFPKLEELILQSLPKFVTFWEWRGDVEWPSLRKVIIIDCPNITNITLGPLTTPNLVYVAINNRYRFELSIDLNAMLQQAIIQSIKEHRKNLAEQGVYFKEDDENEGQVTEEEEEELGKKDNESEGHVTQEEEEELGEEDDESGGQVTQEEEEELSEEDDESYGQVTQEEEEELGKEDDESEGQVTQEEEEKLSEEDDESEDHVTQEEEEELNEEDDESTTTKRLIAYQNRRDLRSNWRLWALRT